MLIGGAFTNRPFFKAMQPLLANELSSEATDRHQTGDESHEYNDTLFLYNSDTMKKFLELIAAFSEMETISAEQKAALDKAFSELTETDKASSKETYNLITGKFSEDNKSTEGTTEEETDETETEEEKTAEEVKASEETEEETDTEEETEEETETETVTEETTETETVTVKASEYENLKKNQGEYAKLVREKRKTLLESKFGELVFNEETKKGAFLPKSKSKLVNFALGLSEKKGDEFFEILKDLALNGSKFSEIGSAATGEKTSEFSEEQIAVVMKTAKVSREDAIVALTEDAAERKANQ